MSIDEAANNGEVILEDEEENSLNDDVSIGGVG
jgi:hypothetical protein